jgi:hypothetical protein
MTISNIIAISCDGRVVKASDSKSDGVTRTGSNPVRSEFMYFFLLPEFENNFLAK